MENTTDAVAADEIRVSIEIGEDYALTPALEAAIDDLRGALADIDGDEVEGFAMTGLEIGDMGIGLDARSLYYPADRGRTYTENDTKGKKKGNIG